jgi:hypothetical protein
MFASFLHHMTRPADRPTPLRARSRPWFDDDAPVTIRVAAGREPAVARLAELDGQLPLSGPSLVAEIDGQPVAALGLTSGTAVADPFRPSAAVLELLRVRAGQLRVVR